MERRLVSGVRRAQYNAVPWCSGLAYLPVKEEIAGSNPVGTARRARRVAPWAHSSAVRAAGS